MDKRTPGKKMTPMGRCIFCDMMTALIDADGRGACCGSRGPWNNANDKPETFHCPRCEEMKLAGLRSEQGLCEDCEDELADSSLEESCPGCGCKPGDGIIDGCDDEDGCGYHGNQS